MPRLDCPLSACFVGLFRAQLARPLPAYFLPFVSPLAFSLSPALTPAGLASIPLCTRHPRRYPRPSAFPPTLPPFIPPPTPSTPPTPPTPETWSPQPVVVGGGVAFSGGGRKAQLSLGPPPRRRRPLRTWLGLGLGVGLG